MAKAKRSFVCQACGTVHAKWSGRCDGCGAWNTIVEEAPAAALPKGLTGGKGGAALTFEGLKGTGNAPARRPTGLAELDRVTGGGLVPGGVILIGGDPGIGKSTLLLQVTAALARTVPCAYVSGEESLDQVRLRAQRLGLADSPLALAAATAVRDIAATLDREDAPAVVVVDSVQTLHLDTLDSAPGTVAQVRASAQELIRIAKTRGFTLFLVGHVTKDGAIAGPRVLEHMVDAVLYFEGDRGHQFRLLRAVKNRFGATDEIGVFEMTEQGLAEVPNPSALFLAERHGNVAGSCVFAGMEGTRPVLVEVQALVSPGGYGTPRRSVVGWDGNRLAMLLAVLEARAGLSLSGNDVFLNMAGGIRVTEPAADVAVAAALVSAATGKPVPADLVAFGEIGLSGEIRPVGQTDARLKEAAKLGFAGAMTPRPSQAARSRKDGAPKDLNLRRLGHVTDLTALFGGGSS